MSNLPTRIESPEKLKEMIEGIVGKCIRNFKFHGSYCLMSFKCLADYRVAIARLNGRWFQDYRLRARAAESKHGKQNVTSWNRNHNRSRSRSPSDSRDHHRSYHRFADRKKHGRYKESRSHERRESRDYRRMR